MPRELYCGYCKYELNHRSTTRTNSYYCMQCGRNNYTIDEVENPLEGKRQLDLRAKIIAEEGLPF